MSSNDLQNHFLAELEKESSNVSIFLISGIKLQGTIIGFDDTSIVLGNTVTQMVYKHAISSIVPEKNIKNISV